MEMWGDAFMKCWTQMVKRLILSLIKINKEITMDKISYIGSFRLSLTCLRTRWSHRLPWGWWPRSSQHLAKPRFCSADMASEPAAGAGFRPPWFPGVQASVCGGGKHNPTRCNSRASARGCQRAAEQGAHGAGRDAAGQVRTQTRSHLQLSTSCNKIRHPVNGLLL